MQDVHLACETPSTSPFHIFTLHQQAQWEVLFYTRCLFPDQWRRLSAARKVAFRVLDYPCGCVYVHVCVFHVSSNYPHLPCKHPINHIFQSVDAYLLFLKVSYTVIPVFTFTVACDSLAQQVDWSLFTTELNLSPLANLQ